MPAAALARLLRPGDTVLVGTGTGEPLELIEALIDASSGFAASPGVRVIQVMTGGTERLAEVSGGALHITTPVPGAKTRKAIADGRASLLAVSMSRLVHDITSGALPIDGVLLQGRALDAHRATPGLIADVMVPAWERARFRAIELNERLPRIQCERLIDLATDLATADIVVRSARAPNELPEDDVSAAAARIGELVAAIVPDGATIELGVGRALAGVVPALARTRCDLAMHTGIVGDAAMRLIEAGVVSRPIRGTALAVGATAMGTAGFYAWANDNPRIALVDSRIAHNADLLAATPKFVAINAGLQVDVAGNVNSTAHRGRVVSGVGGAGDFARAGSRGEASIIAILSTTKDGASTVVPRVEAISIPSALVTHIVTEHGIAAIRGLDAARLRAAIRAIAAPQHRAQLD